MVDHLASMVSGKIHCGSPRLRIRFITALLVVLSVVWALPLFAQSPIVITFGRDEIGKFPSGWATRNESEARKVYSVEAEADKKFLHADAQDVSVQIGYEREWPLEEFPTLQWQWRAGLFPTGTDERKKGGNDSVLGMYIILRGLPLVRGIKYIWSDTLPVGASFDSPHSHGTKIIVLRSGRSQMGMWVAEKRDVLADYRRFFGEGEKNPVAKGIAVLTDSDNTSSRSIGDYADIRVSGREAEQVKKQNVEKPDRPSENPLNSR